MVDDAMYEDHMAAELTALDDVSDGDWEDCAVRTGRRRSRPAPAPKKPALEPKVYVLGGAPSVAVPTNPKKLRLMPIPRQPRAPAAPAFNHYADGGGFGDGDTIGLDGHEGAGVAWEVAGATTF